MRSRVVVVRIETTTDIPIYWEFSSLSDYRQAWPLGVKINCFPGSARGGSIIVSLADFFDGTVNIRTHVCMMFLATSKKKPGSVFYGLGLMTVYTCMSAVVQG